MNRIDTLVEARREKLKDKSIPAGSGHKWGIALSGGGIRSATFCFGLLRALASHKLLLRFDLMSTVSGGGYIASAIGSLFHRASDAKDLHHIQETISEGNPSWFLWWLRANGRYLIPRGTRDRTYAVALFLRNLTAIHFELALVAVSLGLFLSAIDLIGWSALENLGYFFSSSTFFSFVRWLPAWFPVVWFALPFVAVAGAVYSAAYWALPWVVAIGARWWRIWTMVLVADVLLVVLFYFFGDQASESGSDLRTAIWWTTGGLISIWLVSIPAARRYLSKADDFGDSALKAAKARNLLTKQLTRCLQCAAGIAGFGLVDRVAWTLAFEWDGLGKAGLSLAIAAAIVRALLPLASSLLPRKGTRAGLLAIGHVVGYALTFVLCCWWVSLVQKAVLGALFTGRSLHYVDAVTVMALIAIPVVAYIFFTGRNFQFLNLSSLHSFYKGRLTRSYLGAANGKRFDQHLPLGALNAVPAALSTKKVSSSVNDVWEDEDFAMDEYTPQKSGGPVHLINVCVNQTTDPRGRLFNQDRRGLPLTVASGGWMQVAQDGWKGLMHGASLTLGTWTAISGAALAPGLGGMTRGGIAALASFAGLRLGYWWSEAERTNSSPKGTPLLAKSRGILSETFGVFKGAEGPDWFLTDGGHFENTGAYTLLAERTEVIVLADCGADPQYAFGDLENLVRKARIDLQAEIYFQRRKAPDETPTPPATRFGQTYRLARPPQKPAPQELAPFGSLNDLASPLSNSCLALARIEYGGAQPGKGILIVVKPNLCDGLPVDLINFKAENPDFPHQTTADQFFSEAQWESYFLLGQFMGGRLSRAFIERLLEDFGAWFEDDECSPFETRPVEKTKPADRRTGNGSTPASRLPARIGATAVGTTLGLGAVATVGVSAWQAIDSVRTSYSKQTAEERAALKELTDMWTKLPPRKSLNSPGESTSQAYGNLAAALARTADTLCPSDEAGWFIKSPLAGRISKDALRGCRKLDQTQRTEPCHVLIEAANPNLKGPLPNCLSWEEKTKTSVPPPRYWAYDYSVKAKFDAMHPCDPLRAQLARDEAEHRAAYGILTDAQTSSDDRSTNGRTCHVPDSERGVQSMSAATGTAPAGPASAPPSSDTPSASVPASNGAHANASAPPVVFGASSSSSAEASLSPSLIDKDVCKGKTVYVQIYGGSQRDIVRAFRPKWQELGASVPPIEDVLATAQRDGRANPMPVRKTTVRFHDSGSVECAQVLGRAAGSTGWIVEPLSARLKPTKGTIEVWVAPASSEGAN